LEAGLELLVNPPCVIFEDDHLLIVNKPAGMNTHSPSPFAGEGLYEWLKHRESRWADLAIIHRLDKETSGLILFSKTPLANQSLTKQFTTRTVRKKYVLLTDRLVKPRKLEIKSTLVRCGDKYISRPIVAGRDVAHTRFELLKAAEHDSTPPGSLVQAEPLTGRTHQIRVHAADSGIPILGDTRYGGTAARRLCLHAAELEFKHPASGAQLHFQAPADFSADPILSLRRALIRPDSTDAFRLVHGASDGWEKQYVDVLGPYLLAQSARGIDPAHREDFARLLQGASARGSYEKRLVNSVQGAAPAEVSPKLVLGEPAPERFTIRENGLFFELSFAEGYSVGLFLDQRDNRRRLLTGHIAAEFPLFESGQGPGRKEVLNAFAYTCGFSACAAHSLARITSLDLSRKYLEWGKANFRLNGINPADHDFIFGDVFDWFKRLRKKGRQFDVILLDPPTFSRSKEFGVFRVDRDYGHLVSQALPLLKSRGVMFASCNSANWAPELFLESIKAPIHSAKRQIAQEHYFPQPPDFPVSRDEPAYLKTVWLRIH
jgi:23S rRNA (cytosine1962-C5)-methyltransferase